MSLSTLTENITATPMPVAAAFGVTPEQVAKRVVNAVFGAASDRFASRFGYRPDVEARRADRMVIRQYLRVLSTTAQYGYVRHPDWSVNDRVIYTIACIEVAAHSEWPEVLNEHTD